MAEAYGEGDPVLVNRPKGLRSLAGTSWKPFRVVENSGDGCCTTAIGEAPAVFRSATLLVPGR